MIKIVWNKTGIYKTWHHHCSLRMISNFTPYYRMCVITYLRTDYIDGLVQHYSNFIANALEVLQSCAKPSMCCRKIKALFFMYTCCHYKVPLVLWGHVRWSLPEDLEIAKDTRNVVDAKALNGSSVGSVIKSCWVSVWKFVVGIALI